MFHSQTKIQLDSVVQDKVPSHSTVSEMDPILCGLGETECTRHDILKATNAANSLEDGKNGIAVQIINGIRGDIKWECAAEHAHACSVQSNVPDVLSQATGEILSSTKILSSAKALAVQKRNPMNQPRTEVNSNPIATEKNKKAPNVIHKTKQKINHHAVMDDLRSSPILSIKAEKSDLSTLSEA